MKRGFSLLELSIVIALSGLMVGFVVQTTQASKASDCYLTTRAQVNAIHDAVDSFVRKNDRYPTPAQRNLGVNDPNYGREAIAANTTQASGVSFGALPFQALGLPTSFAGDCWGNKFSYAVTTALTTNATSGGYLDPAVSGNIKIMTGVDGSGSPLYGSTTAAYGVISHGEDGFGAVALNYTGGTANWCTGASSLKSANCLASTNVLANAITNSGKSAGSNYFDDIVITADRAKVMTTSSWTGNAYCWGYNGQGQIGNNTSSLTVRVPLPTQAFTNQTFARIVTNTSYISRSNISCGLNTAGYAYCWGPQGTKGSVGCGPASANCPAGLIMVPTAVDQSTSGAFTAITLATYGGCGINGSGQAYCWGQINGTSNLSPVALDQSGSGALTTLAGGENVTCGINASNAAWCWGSNWYGVFGNGSVNDGATGPVAVAGGHSFVQVSPGYKNGCAIDTAGAAWCWGLNANGEVGNATTTANYTPQAVSMPTDPSSGLPYTFALIASGVANTCALTPTGIAYCWGSGTYGAIGDGTTGTNRTVPTLVSGGLTFKKLVMGAYRTCGITAAGANYCWGSNSNSQIGNNTNVDSNVPTLTTGSGSTYLFGDLGNGSGSTHTCALTNVPCQQPWGGYIPNASSVTAYQAASGASCSSELRTCNNGTLSGSFQFQACTPAPVGTCDLPWGGTINEGQSITAWHSPNYETWCNGPKGTACTQSMQCHRETRTCTGGVLSGSFQYQACPDAV